jgi:N-acetylmuramoyl-L-alanine amidase/AmpD protein
VVLHATVLPTLEKTTRRFLDPESRVSAHYTIGKDGSIVQCVSPLNRAWHAGESLDSEGRTHVNDFSIGIELVNLNDGIDPYPVAQIDVLTNMLIGFRAMGFSLRYIASHEAVAMPRGRKSDPKGFPWEALENLGMALIR